MSPQAGTAMQPAKTPAPVSQSPAGEIFDRIQQTYDAIARRAFEIFDARGRQLGSEWDNWLRAESELLHPVHLEVEESDDSLTVRAEVPGFNSKEVEINVEPRRITIAGKHEAHEENKKGRTIYSEQCASEILRAVDLPTEVDGTKASATLKDGILNIHLPKSPHAKAVRLEPKNV